MRALKETCLTLREVGMKLGPVISALDLQYLTEQVHTSRMGGEKYISTLS